jgi:hypothetical protein
MMVGVTTDLVAALIAVAFEMKKSFFRQASGGENTSGLAAGAPFAHRTFFPPCIRSLPQSNL